MPNSQTIDALQQCLAFPTLNEITDNLNQQAATQNNQIKLWLVAYRLATNLGIKQQKDMAIKLFSNNYPELDPIKEVFIQWIDEPQSSTDLSNDSTQMRVTPSLNEEPEFAKWMETTDDFPSPQTIAAKLFLKLGNKATETSGAIQVATLDKEFLKHYESSFSNTNKIREIIQNIYDGKTPDLSDELQETVIECCDDLYDPLEPSTLPYYESWLYMENNFPEPHALMNALLIELGKGPKEGDQIPSVEYRDALFLQTYEFLYLTNACEDIIKLMEDIHSNESKYDRISETLRDVILVACDDIYDPPNPNIPGMSV